MTLSIWSWFSGLFAPALRFIFRCIVCGLERVIEAATDTAAKRAIEAAGWKGPQHPGDAPGWRCSDCAGK